MNPNDTVVLWRPRYGSGQVGAWREAAIPEQRDRGETFVRLDAVLELLRTEAYDTHGVLRHGLDVAVEVLEARFTDRGEGSR